MEDLVRVLEYVVIPAVCGFSVVWYASERRLLSEAMLFGSIAGMIVMVIMLASGAHAADKVPATMPDGRAIMATNWPAGADKVCFVGHAIWCATEALRMTPQDTVVFEGLTLKVTPNTYDYAAIVAVALNAGEAVAAVASNAAGDSDPSTDRYIGPQPVSSVVRPIKPVVIKVIGIVVP